jgi:hypothetical protein
MFSRYFMVFAGAALAPGCGATERPPHIEDAARAMAPVPACIAPLGASASRADGTFRRLSDDEYWKLVFPAYDARNHTLDADALTCTGAAVFQDPVFAGGTARGNPIPVQPEDIVYGSGGDRVRIVWLRTHRWPDGSEGGPLALVRANGDYAEVYAIGAYRGSPSQSTLETERIGTEVLVSATNDGCLRVPKTAPCETEVTLMLPRLGHLDRVAVFATERRAFATGSEPGVQGQVTYELSAAPQYSDKGVSVFEEVKATDAEGRVVHRTELERVFLLQDGAMQQESDSLWGHMYPGVASKQPSAR